MKFITCIILLLLLYTNLYSYTGFIENICGVNITDTKEINGIDIKDFSEFGKVEFGVHVWTNWDQSNDYGLFSSTTMFNGAQTFSVLLYPTDWGEGNYGRILDDSSSSGDTLNAIIIIDGALSTREQMNRRWGDTTAKSASNSIDLNVPGRIC